MGIGLGEMRREVEDLCLSYPLCRLKWSMGSVGFGGLDKAIKNMRKVWGEDLHDPLEMEAERKRRP